MTPYFSDSNNIKRWLKTVRRPRNSSICLLSDAILIWIMEKLLVDNFDSKNSGVNYFVKIVSLINSSFSNFWADIW